MAVMERALIAIAALSLYIWGWRTCGFRKATLWACLTVISIYPFAFTGMLLPSIFDIFGVHEVSMRVRMAGGVMAIVAAMIAAKYLGWGKVLGWAFSAAMVVSAFVIMGFLFFVLLAVAAGGH
jgi:hypothetical protein